MPTKSSSRTKGTWGGKREGAGRKPAPGSFGKGHHVRAPHDPRKPVEVLLRTLPGLAPVPRAALREALERADEIIDDRADFQVKDFAVQKNNVHLVTKAASLDDLSAGMHSLTIVLARAINRALDRSGKVFAYRYFTSQR
jgi:putative transposase